LKILILSILSGILLLISSGAGSAVSEAEPIISVCSSSASVTITGNVVSTTPPVTPVRNPAAAHCVDQGHSYEIRTDPVTGDQTGYCVFPDQSSCEEWAFFRGTCVYTPASPPPQPPDDPLLPDDSLLPTDPIEEAKDEISDEIRALEEKEAQGTLNPEEMARLADKRVEMLEAEIVLLESGMEVLKREKALLDIQGRRLLLEEERLALALESKKIERRSYLGSPEEGDGGRLSEIKLLLLLLDLKAEALDIEERAILGTSAPGDPSRMEDLAAAIAYLGSQAGVG
jgi:putative hemolysin